MKNLHPYHLFEPAFLWQLLLQYAHYFVCVNQIQQGEKEKAFKIFLLNRDTLLLKYKNQVYMQY
jgi:hypothetical protein